MTCRFCRIPDESPSEVIFQNDDAYVIIPLRRDEETGALVEWDPATHRLVIPRHHAEEIRDLDGDWDAVMLVAEDQKRRMGGDAIISFNLGPDAGQTQRHIHLWVRRCPGDEPSAGMGVATLKRRLNELLAS